MEDKNSKQYIQDLRDKMLNGTLVAYSVLSVFVFILVLFRQREIVTRFAFVLQTAGVTGLLLLTFLRHKLSFPYKIYFLFIISTLIVFPGVIEFGFLASSKVMIVIYPALAAFFLSFRRVIYILFVYVAIYMAIGLLFHYQIIDYEVDANYYIRNPRVWFADATAIFMSSFGLLYMGYYYSDALLKNNLQINRANVELQNQEKKFRMLYESSLDAIFLIRDNKIFECNSVGVDMFRQKKEELLDTRIISLFPEKQPDGENSVQLASSILGKIYTGEQRSLEWLFNRKDGSSFYASVNLSLVDLEDTKYIQAVLQDITLKKQVERQMDEYRIKLENQVKKRTVDLERANLELKMSNKELTRKSQIIIEKNNELVQTMKELKDTQSQLIQAEKMASLGILTAGVAHEINNPLNFIVGGYEGLKDYLAKNGDKNDPTLDIMLSGIKTGVDRAAEIVKGLNVFTRSNDRLDEECNIEAIIENSLLITGSQLKGRINVTTEYNDHNAVVPGNAGKLHQVIINILINSSQAIIEGGEIAIQTFIEGKWVIVEISDTGIGMDEELLSKIMDPFFTTKEPGMGTGLGLSITYSIVQEHGGSIIFSSVPGEGTKARIELPRMI